MEDCHNENLLAFHSVQNPVRESMIYRPASDLEIQDLHRQGLIGNSKDGELDGRLKTLRQFWANLAVVGLLGANVCLRRSEDSDGLQ